MRKRASSWLPRHSRGTAPPNSYCVQKGIVRFYRWMPDRTGLAVYYVRRATSETLRKLTV